MTRDELAETSQRLPCYCGDEPACDDDTACDRFPVDACTCNGCWACPGRQRDCTCHVDWDEVFGA